MATRNTESREGAMHPRPPADVWGRPGPRAVVLLHGAVVNRRMWRAIGEDVARTGWPVVAPDLPGHGELTGVRFRFDTAVGDVLGLLDAEGVEEAVLAGESLGGYVAIAAAAACPSRVAGIVLSGATLNPTGPTAVLVRAYAAALRAAAGLIGRPTLRAWTERALRRLHPEARHEEMAGPGLSVKGRHEALREMAGRDFAADLAALHVPVLVLNGGRDVANRAGARSFLRDVPQAEIRRVSGAGHGVALTRPGTFSRELARFLERRLGG